LAVEYLREPVAAVLDFVVASEQAGLHALDVGRLAAADAQMADDEVAEHFGEEIIEIGARADAFDEALVPLFRLPQVQPVEARVVEEVALDAPRLVEHLRPL